MQGVSVASVDFSHYKTVLGKDRCFMVQEYVQAGLEKVRSSRMEWIRQEGTWTRIRSEQTMNCKHSWAEFWRTEPLQIKFPIHSIYSAYFAGIWQKHQHACCARKGDLWNRIVIGIITEANKCTLQGNQSTLSRRGQRTF